MKLSISAIALFCVSALPVSAGASADAAVPLRGLQNKDKNKDKNGGGGGGGGDGATGTPIVGAPTDCSAPTHTYAITDAVTMNYVVNPTSITFELLFAGVESWVSLAVDNGKGKMVGGEAIIGHKPSGDGAGFVVEKFVMDGEDLNGVRARGASEQTLTGTAMDQSGDGSTTLKFTKLLVETGEIPLTADGTNYFTWAFGYPDMGSLLGLHDKKEGAGAFSLDVTLCVPTGTTPATTPAVQPDATGMEEDGSGMTEPVPAPVPATLAPTKATVDANVTDLSATSCADYQTMVSIDDNLDMYYVVNRGTAGDGSDDTISVKLACSGKRWVSLGIGPESAPARMVGGDAVIALPDDSVSPSNPGFYSMTSDDNDGVNLMDDALQTLTGQGIVQNTTDSSGWYTDVTFTRTLVELGNGKNSIAVSDTADTTFIWAYGYSNDLNLHKAFGAFTIPLSYCEE